MLGCDQVLSLKGESFDKAESHEEAERRLAQFSGQDHFLHSAVVHAVGGQIIEEFCVDVPMRMKNLSDTQIKAYVATNEWKGCVGCYQYENRGRNLFDASQNQDQSAIIGLPLSPLLENLEKLGIDVLLQPSGPWDLNL